MTTWIQEQEAKLRHEDDIALVAQHQIVEEITRKNTPSFRHRVARILRGREHNRYEEASEAARSIIIEPGDAMGSAYVAYQPGKDF